MNQVDSLPIYISMYKLIRYLYLLIKNFRKELKYSLGEDIISLGWSVLDYVIQANSSPNNKKYHIICDASIAFDKFKMRLRMAHEMKLISHKQYAYITTQTVDIGKMLNGWRLWAEKLYTKQTRARA